MDHYGKALTFAGNVPVKKSTFMEKVMIELWYKKNNVEPPKSALEYIPKVEDIGISPEVSRILEMI